MAKRGRKSGFNSKILGTILRLIEAGKTEAEIAEVIGVCLKTIANWKGKHPELLHAVREARQVADDLVEASLYQRAVGYTHPEEKVFQYEGGVVTHDTKKHYPPDTAAAMFWLRNRQPGRWKEKVEGDVTVNVNAIQKLTDEELDARIAAKTKKDKK